MPGTIEPTGELGKTKKNLAYLIASCATFRTITGTATATLAMEKIHYLGDDTSDTTETRPRCLIDTERFDRRTIALADEQPFGTLYATFEFLPSSAYASNPDDEQIEMENRLDAILSEMNALKGRGTGYFSGCTHLYYRTLELILPPTYGAEIADHGGTQSREYFWQSVLGVEI